MACSLYILSVTCILPALRNFSFLSENSQSDFVLFQSISTIREAVIREWPILPPEEKVELRGYLMQYLTSHPSVAPYVRNQVLHIVALLVKRATLEVNCEELFGSVLDSVAQMLSSGDVSTVRSGCGFMGPHSPPSWSNRGAAWFTEKDLLTVRTSKETSVL